MTPPLCIGKGCSKPVQKRYGTVQPKRGWRIIGDVHWNWFCSRSCSGRDPGHIRPEASRRVGLGNRTRAERRVLKRLVEACKGVMDEQGRVPAKAMVRVLMGESRKAYARGVTSIYRKWERAA